jgi:DNA-binding MarR family transcriptional regulator
LHSRPSTPRTTSSLDELTEAVLSASRALLAVAVQSIGQAGGGVTMPQFRALVVLAEFGPQNLRSLAEHLGVHPSTATRLCDRLVAKDLVQRETSVNSRREITLQVTKGGAGVVRDVLHARRREIRRILADLPAKQRVDAARAFAAFAAARGEVPEESWAVGWAASPSH